MDDISRLSKNMDHLVMVHYAIGADIGQFGFFSFLEIQHISHGLRGDGE
jgi:hypothetical protein